MGRRKGIIAAVVAGAALLSGCTTVAGTAVAPPSVTEKIATGNYPTKPRTVAAKNAADAWHQEGWRIGDAVASPWEIDPSLTSPASGTGPVFDPRYFELRAGECIFTKEQLAVFGPDRFLTGFLARLTSVDKELGLTVGFLRFADDATAARVVDGLGRSSSGACGTRAYRTDVAVAGSGLVAVASTSTEGVEPDVATLDRITSAAIRSQVGRVPLYAPTVVDRKGPPDVPMDVDGIMSRTLATRGPGTLGLSEEVGIEDGYMSPHTYALVVPSTRTVAGAQLIGRTRMSTITRFNNAGAATAFAKESSGGQKGTSVPGVPAEAASCHKIGEQYGCVVQVGRYVGQAITPTEPQTVQAAAATYLILKAAGQ